MEKYINWFRSLDTLQKYEEINLLSKVIKQEYKSISNYKQANYIVSKSSNNASKSNKNANFATKCRIHEENKQLLKEYIKLI